MTYANNLPVLFIFVGCDMNGNLKLTDNGKTNYQIVVAGNAPAKKHEILIGKKLIVAGGIEKDSLYGVYTLLDDVPGCKKYTEDCSPVRNQFFKDEIAIH